MLVFLEFPHPMRSQVSRRDLRGGFYTITMICLYYTILYYTILYCTILYYNITIICYTILYHTILYYTIIDTGMGSEASDRDLRGWSYI